MFKKILVPTDGSAFSEKANNAAVEFAAGIGAKIVTISVADPYGPQAAATSPVPLDPNFYDDDTQRILDTEPQQAAKRNVQYVNNIAVKAGVSCEMLTATSTDPYEEIVKAVKSFQCDLIFMASHGRKGLSKLILGSETQKVIAYSSVPVLVYR